MKVFIEFQSDETKMGLCFFREFPRTEVEDVTDLLLGIHYVIDQWSDMDSEDFKKRLSVIRDEPSDKEYMR